MIRNTLSALALLAPVVAVACGGKVFVDLPNGSGGGGAGGMGGQSSSSFNVIASVGPTTTVSVGPSVVSAVSTGGFDCTSEPDCQLCCIDSFPGGYEALLKLYVFECACKDPSAPCFMQCADPNGGCAGGGSQPDRMCTECLNNNQRDQCVQIMVDKCNQEPECAAVLECFQIC